MVYNTKDMLARGEFFATIEIPLEGDVKYEIDKDSQRLVVDRILNVSMRYPCNYGYVEGTMGSDGDPVDVCLILDKALMPGCYIKCKAVGVLVMEDESGIDEKILAVPVKSEFNDIDDIDQVSHHLLSKFKHFFERYKDLEQGKWVKIDKWENRSHAVNVLVKSFDSAS